MGYREQIAIDHGMDNTLSFLREGYEYISNRTKRYNRNMFETRLLGGKKFVCMAGKEAAEVFYDESKLQRHGAAPGRVLKTLFGEKGVQTLENKAHRNRKALFMSLMTEEQLQDVAAITKAQWEVSLPKWADMDGVASAAPVWRGCFVVQSISRSGECINVSTAGEISGHNAL